jgi:hypothetical protein
LPDGLSFSEPVEITFSLTDSVLAGTDTLYVDIARQNDDGVWGVLKNRRLDWDAHTITCTTSHLSDYSLTDGVQIRPARALAVVHQSVPLVVRYCERSAIAGDPDLVALVIDCDDDSAPLNSFTNWSVNSIVGGNSTVGRVAPTSGQQVTYTAPATEPDPNTVAVSVRTDYYGSVALLVSNITIGSTEDWDGEITAIYPNGDRARSLIRWVFTGQADTQKIYKPEGPVEYTLGFGDCAFVSLSPDSYTFDGTEGVMIIDYAVDPPSVLMAFGTFWDAEHCYQCPDHPVQCATIQLAPSYHVNGEVSGANLDVIEALGASEDDVSYTYRFEKVAPPSTPESLSHAARVVK